MLTETERLLVIVGLWTLATGTWAAVIVAAIWQFRAIRDEWRRR